MTRQDKNIFFALIRAAIWTDQHGHITSERKTELEQLIPDFYDWSMILQLCQDHALVGIVANPLCSLSKTKSPTSKQMDLLLSTVSQLVRQRYVVRQVIAELFSRLSAAKCHPILLKGEGLAMLYPNTCQRSVGDIDIFVIPDEYECAKMVLNELCPLESRVGQAHEGRHHYEIEYCGIPIELHFKAGISADSRYESSYYDYTLRELHPEKCDTIFINNQPILVPRARYNLVYNFNHICQHWVNSGIGIRQFVDYALLFAQVHNDVFFSRLYEDLKLVGLWKQWCRLKPLFNGLLTKTGYCINSLPLKLQRITNILIMAGNFGRQLDYIGRGISDPPGFKRKLTMFLSQYKSARVRSLLFPYQAYSTLFMIVISSIRKSISQKKLYE